MTTVAMSLPMRKHPLAHLLSMLFRKSYPEGAPAPCCEGERQMGDPRNPGRTFCEECGKRYRKAA